MLDGDGENHRRMHRGICCVKRGGGGHGAGVLEEREMRQREKGEMRKMQKQGSVLGRFRGRGERV